MRSVTKDREATKTRRKKTSLRQRTQAPSEATTQRAQSLDRSKPAKKGRMRAAPGAVSTQDLYTGMSGQFFAMSKFLWRGYNVAVPAIDVGEDVFVVEATTEKGRGMLRRVQVKTAGRGKIENGNKIVQFNLSRIQLNTAPSHGELYYMFITRWDDMNPAIDWRFVLISRVQLNDIRAQMTASGGPGRRPKEDGESQDQITIRVKFSEQDALAWGQSLKDYMDRWSAEWDIGSPMQGLIANSNAIKQPSAPAPIEQSPAPNADLETKQ